MRTQLFKLAVANCLLAAGLFGADNPFFGKWKLMAEKSKFAPGEEIREMTKSFSPEGEKIRMITTGTYMNGKPVEEGGPNGDAFAWDGHEHVVHEASPKISIVCTTIRNGATHVTIHVDGQLAEQIVSQVSADGQTLTETSEHANQQGKHSKTVLLFERQ